MISPQNSEEVNNPRGTAPMTFANMHRCTVGGASNRVIATAAKVLRQRAFENVERAPS
jgi:hypothetical protein